ncbi:MAG TPA: transglutaminase domain-containing protein [Thermoanaerobaculia bacterium]|nr:transglutaminase domain-containing protein [Thermoanaerobaculia bacterium]
MTRKARELETLLLTVFAAVPLYFTNAVGKAPVLLYQLAMGAIALRVAMGKGPDILPANLMRWLAIAYMPFYFVDWRFFSGSAIAASTHLVLFIAVYQPIESMQRDNQAQRMLTTALIFVASLATSTHITIVVFVLVFALLMFRQFMYVSHIETVRSIGAAYAEPPSGRAALFYLAGSIAIGALLFPILPRVRNPFVSGFAGSLGSSATSLSDTIDFGDPRRGNADATVVARVWLDDDARASFTPIRLRGMIYDRYTRGAWAQTLRGIREVPSRGGAINIGRARGREGGAIVQQRAQRGKLYLPVGTYSVDGLPGRLYEGPARETYYTYADGMLNLSVRMAADTEPLRLTRIAPVDFPVTPEVAALARQIVGNETRLDRRAALIEQHLVRNYRYLPNTAASTAGMTIEDFLLVRREGHCEYFAAGMVVLLTSLDIPARIAGGFYAGRLNPLTGYYAIRREDAHAWTEVWDGTRWLTFDATPADLRPGSAPSSVLREYASVLGDSLTFIWDRYVLTFGLGDQISLVEDLIDWGRTAMARARARAAQEIGALTSTPYVTAFALLVLSGALVVFFARRRGPLFEELARHLARHGIEVGPAMTMEDALRELRTQKPDAARALEPLIALYEEERFSARPERGRAMKLRRRLRELRA